MTSSIFEIKHVNFINLSIFSAYGSTTFTGKFKMALAKKEVIFKSSSDQPDKTANILYLDEHFM